MLGIMNKRGNKGWKLAMEYLESKGTDFEWFVHNWDHFTSYDHAHIERLVRVKDGTAFMLKITGGFKYGSIKEEKERESS